MVRLLLLLISFATLAAWAGAQGPTSLAAEDKMKLFKSNRVLIENLVNHGIDLSASESSFARAHECRKTAVTLGNYLERAAKDDQNPDRVAELAGLMGDVVRDGLVPIMDEAKDIPPGSPDGVKFAQLRETVVTDLDNVQIGVPAGKIGDNAKVKAAMASLAELKSKFAK